MQPTGIFIVKIRSAGMQFQSVKFVCIKRAADFQIISDISAALHAEFRIGYHLTASAGVRRRADCRIAADVCLRRVHIGGGGASGSGIAQNLHGVVQQSDLIGISRDIRSVRTGLKRSIGAAACHFCVAADVQIVTDCRRIIGFHFICSFMQSQADITIIGIAPNRSFHIIDIQ